MKMYRVESWHNKNMYKYTEKNVTRRNSEILKVTLPSELVSRQDYFGAPKIAVPRSWAPQNRALIRPCLDSLKTAFLSVDMCAYY